MSALHSSRGVLLSEWLFAPFERLGFTGAGDVRILGVMAGVIASDSVLGAADREFLLGLARQAIVRNVGAGGEMEWEPVCNSPALLAKRACFVTLTVGGELRGCIGNLTAEAPLFRAVIHNANGAARRDPRFAPVERVELAKLRIEISVLGEAVELTGLRPDEVLDVLVPGRHGVVLRCEDKVATFLPQVWRRIPERHEFLKQLSLKAGASADGWRRPGAVLALYAAESFQEEAEL